MHLHSRLHFRTFSGFSGHDFLLFHLWVSSPQWGHGHLTLTDVCSSSHAPSTLTNVCSPPFFCVFAFLRQSLLVLCQWDVRPQEGQQFPLVFSFLLEAVARFKAAGPIIRSLSLIWTANYSSSSPRHSFPLLYTSLRSDHDCWSGVPTQHLGVPWILQRFLLSES